MRHPTRRVLRSLPLLVALAGLALTVPAAPLAAQNPGATPPDESELRTFALAWREMVDIQRTLEGNLEAAPESEHPQLRGLAQMEFQDVIAESPMSLRRYTEIGRMLDRDAELRGRLQAMLEALEEGGGR